MRVVICDDHAMFTDSLALVLRDSGHDVVGVAYSPGSLRRLLPNARADVCLIDVGFPAGSVLEDLPDLLAAAPGTRFVLLTGSLDTGTVEAGLAAGVRGFADKGGQARQIVDLLDRVHAGEVVRPASMRRPAPGPRGEARRLAGYLTPREREVLVRLVRGENTAALARNMRITRSTARSHVQSVLTKLGVHSQREAVIAAARYGLVSVRTGEWLL